METWDRGILTRLELRTPAGRSVFLLFLVLLLLLAFTVLFPFLYAFTAGLKSSLEIYNSGLQIFPADPQWSNYATVFTKYNFLTYFKNSFIVVGGGLICQLTVTTLAAYSLARLKPFGGRLILGGFMITLMIPQIAYIIPLFTTLINVPILNISLLGSYWGLWLPYSVNAFGILIMKIFFESIPDDLYDAAKVDGASPLQIFVSITLPLARGIIAVMLIVGFIGLWKDFLLPLLVLRNNVEMQPITVRLWYMLNASTVTAPAFNEQMAASFLALLPPIIVAITLQRYLQRGLSVGAVKG
ncbi:MAG TPA: carbohydrate ABC transporter permease [Aggregatilineales bacterium]|nr:carbohydrate ABC transporter permease [Aggregatilineales bacterium]